MPSAYQFSVCPHDTAKNLLGWYTLNTYLQRRLGFGIHFEPEDNFLVERRKVLESNVHLVYANPASALCYAREKGFVPVARPAGVVDEVMVACRASAQVPEQPRVASATDKLIVHGLGRQVLRELGLDPDGVSYVYTGNHLKAAKAVLDGEADLGFIFNETWHGLSEPIRADLQLLGESRDGHAFHCFMVGPGWAECLDQVRELLCGMHQDPRGLSVLKDLGFSALQAAGPGDIDRLEQALGACA